MDMGTYDRLVAERIEKAREARSVSLNALAIGSGIPFATLHRKLNHTHAFTGGELYSIALVLKLSTRDLLPTKDEVAQAEVAA